MNDKPAMVKNAADPRQVRESERKERFSRREELDDVCFVLSAVQGRRFLWRLLTYCKVFASIWRASAEIHHLSGKQDVGHFVMSEITQADADAFLTMMKESQQREELQK